MIPGAIDFSPCFALLKPFQAQKRGSIHCSPHRPIRKRSNFHKGLWAHFSTLNSCRSQMGRHLRFSEIIRAANSRIWAKNSIRIPKKRHTGAGMSPDREGAQMRGCGVGDFPPHLYFILHPSNRLIFNNGHQQFHRAWMVKVSPTSHIRVSGLNTFCTPSNVPLTS